MPSIPIRRPQRSSIDHAARRIYEILESEDRKKRQLRDQSRLRQADATVGSASQARDTTDAGANDQDTVSRPRGGIDEQRAEQLDMRRARADRKAGEVEPQPQPATEYGLRDWISDQLSGVGADDYENYVGAKAAISEMVGSQLPGRERARRMLTATFSGRQNWRDFSGKSGRDRYWSFMNAKAN